MQNKSWQDTSLSLKSVVKDRDDIPSAQQVIDTLIKESNIEARLKSITKVAIILRCVHKDTIRIKVIRLNF